MLRHREDAGEAAGKKETTRVDVVSEEILPRTGIPSLSARPRDQQGTVWLEYQCIISLVCIAKNFAMDMM